MAAPSAQAQRFQIVSHNQSRGFQQQASRWVIRPPQQQQTAPNRFPAPAPRNNQPPQQQQFRQGNGNKCFTCGNVGHYSPFCGNFTLILPSQGSTQSCVFTMTELPLKKIPVVCEYADVFPDELPRMPPDRDIEFAIELQPGTTPISKRPY
jgi:hypothetical protein